MRLMKGLKRFGLPFAAIIFFLSGCYQDEIEFIPSGTNADIQNFFSAIQTLEDNVLFNVNDGTVIVTDDNSLLHIGPKIFVDANGNLVENSDVRFEYLLIKDKGVLIMYNKPTISDGRLLESGGVFHFEAWNADGTERYYLAPGASIQVQSTSDNPIEGMQLFYGEELSDGEYNWDFIEPESPDWAVPINEWIFGDSTNMFIDGFGYDFLIDSLTWINCDIFNDISDDLKTMACVELPEQYTNQNTVVFAVFTDINSVVALQGDPNLKMFCEPYSQMPIGYDVTFVSISALGNDEYYFGMKNAVLEENHQEIIFPESKTLQEILDILGMF